MENNVRQGDILLKRINGIGGKLVGNGKRVLAYGEKTGHSHILNGDISYYENNGMLMAQIRNNAELVHEEHKNIGVPPGDYLVIRQRELDLVEEMQRPLNNGKGRNLWRTVAD